MENETTENPSWYKVWHFKELQEYKEENKIKLIDEEAVWITKKIAKHFKIGQYTIGFHGYNGSARISRFGHYVTYSHNPTMYLICHELCHALVWKKYNRQIEHGSKKWKSGMKRLIAYCKKKNFWIEERQRRSQPKPQKPEPTKDEIKQQKIAKAEAKIKRYETKIKLYTKKLSRTKRSLTMLKK
jgi:hypothetical protein